MAVLVPNSNPTVPCLGSTKRLVRDDLVVNVRKFLSQISQTIQQIEGEIKLELPDIPNLGTGTISRDARTLERLEYSATNWAHSIQSVVDSCLQRERVGSGPLAEVDYWKERSGVLSSMWEQIKLPQVPIYSTRISIVPVAIMYIHSSIQLEVLD